MPTRTSSLGEEICRTFLPIIKLSPTTKQNYLEFLFEHRHVEYLLKEGITNSDGMHFRPGIYHRANEEPSYENRLGSENYGAWLHDPIDGTAYVYVNTYFKPRVGYVVYQPDTTQIATNWKQPLKARPSVLNLKFVS